MYSLNLPVPLLSTALRILSRKRLCANHLGASSRGAVLSYASIASWVPDFIGAFLLRVLCAGGSYVSFFIICWDASRGYRCGVSGYSTLGGGPTLVDVAPGVAWVLE